MKTKTLILFLILTSCVLQQPDLRMICPPILVTYPNGLTTAKLCCANLGDRAVYNISATVSIIEIETDKVITVVRKYIGDLTPRETKPFEIEFYGVKFGDDIGFKTKFKCRK